MALAARVDGGIPLVYLVGDWPARLGIALVADRLGALMVLVTVLLAVPCLLHACGGGWDRRVPHFHALFQLQLAGLSGAFLTGDLFNLFVFFEVLLIASYGLLLGGGRGARMRAGLHYIAFNITASTLFLIALGLLYGMTGTLNMAEMALRVAALPAGDVPLVRAAAGLLLVVFCAKAALLPLHLWLPQTYARAPAAVAALFAVMTKVGVYAVLRVYALVFGTQAGPLAGWAWDWLLPAGIATLALAALGAVAARGLRMLAGYLVIASAATLFVAIALATPDAVGAGLYYLVHSTFAAAALMLLADAARRAGVTRRAAPALAYVVVAVSIAGLPPLSGFIGKALLLQAVPPQQTVAVWAAVLGASLLMVVALARAGVRAFWEPAGRAPSTADVEPAAPPADPARTPWPQSLALALLVGYGVALAVAAAPVQRFARAAAVQALEPAAGIEAVRATAPRVRAPSP